MSYLNISELDFDLIKQNFKEYLKSQTIFQDYDFDGSSLSVLLDILAYNTYYSSFYLNSAVNESFLDTAQIRKNVVSRAKELNYTPRSMIGATAYIDVVIDGDSVTNQANIILSKYTKFSTSIEDTDYTFCATNSYSVFRDSDTNDYIFSNVEIKEGTPVNYRFTVDHTNPDQRFIIPSANIDISTLVVQTTDNDVNEDNAIMYSLAGEVNTITELDYVYWLEETDNGFYEIKFGDGIVGYKPDNGLRVVCTYLATSGPNANKASSFTLVDSIGGYTDGITITTKSIASGGAERESIDNIKFLAPKHYESQNRAVTADDYKNIILNNYVDVDSISVWGGEEHSVATYGKVFISIKPKSGYYLSDTEKAYIVNNILKPRNVVSITPEIIDPDYLYITVSPIVKYRQSNTIKTAGTLKGDVINAIKNYRDNYLGDFDNMFRFSNLSSIIDNTNKAITNNLTTIFIKKEFNPVLNTYERYDLNFYNEIEHPYDGYRSITSSRFTFVDNNGTIYRNCTLDDMDVNDDLERSNNMGYIKVKHINPTTGVQSIVNTQYELPYVGVINYETGVVSLYKPFKVYDYSGDVLEIFVEPKYKDIVPVRNVLLYIKNTDIFVTMVDENTIGIPTPLGSPPPRADYQTS